MAEKKAKPIPDFKTYRLKVMVLARMLSEALLLVILGVLPIVLLCLNKFATLPLAGKIVFTGLSIISFVVLPFFGFITWQVKTNARGIRCIALFKQQWADWNDVQTIERKSSWNWLRYVVETDGEDLHFPTLLKDCDILVDEIREHLPKGAPSRNPHRSFEHDKVTALLQIAQAFYGLIFIAIIWTFYASLHFPAEKASDGYVVLAFCLAVSALLLWRTFMVALMPKSVDVLPEKVVLRTQFFVRDYPYTALKAVKPSSPFLPEGFIISTRGGSYLVSSNMNSADELQDILLSKLALLKP